MKKVLVLTLIIAASFSAIAAAPQAKKTASPKKTTAQNAAQQLTDSLNAIIQKANAGDAEAQNTVGSWYYKGTNNCQQDFKKALQYWALSAKQGNAMAIGNMAICYQFGRGTEKDSMVAVQLYDKSIENGNKIMFAQHEKESKGGRVFSSMYCAHCYKEGIGTTKDIKKSILYYMTAANQGSVDAMRLAGLGLLNGNNATEAAKMFEKGAAANDATCLYWYGKLLLDGKGVKQDRDKAVAQLTKAAIKNFPMAMYQLGVCYKEGLGTGQDASKSAEFFGKAAARGIDAGKWAYAMALVNGEGVKKDYEKALFWFSRTLKGDYGKQFQKLCTETEDGNWVKTDFMTYLRGMKSFYEGRIDEAAKAFKSIQKTVVEAPLMLALCQLSPDNAKANAKKGMKMLEQAAANDPRAYYYLAKEYENGNTATKKDMEKAISLMKKAADADYYLAQCFVGDVCFEGKLVPVDYAEAARLYTAAVNQGMITSTSAKHLVTCYENAWGVEKNTSYAEYVKNMDTADYRIDLYKLF